MAKFQITTPDGRKLEITAPDGTSKEEALAFAQQRATFEEVKSNPAVSFGVDEFAPNAKPYDVDSGVASAMNVGQGITMGWGDEVAGALGLDRDRYRSTVKKFQQDWPKTSVLGQVSGGMLVPFGGAKFAEATQAANPYLVAAGIGGAQGAIQGAGDSEQSSDMVGDATRSGALGMAAAPILLGTVGTGGNILSALGANTIARLPVVGEKLTKSLARTNVARAFDRDQIDPADVGGIMQQLGSESRIADAGGKNVRGSLDINASMPGTTGNKLELVQEARIAGRPDRLDPIVDDLSGGLGRAKDFSESLSNLQSTKAAPLYKQAHSRAIAPSAQLTNDLEAARQLGAWGEAKKRALANPKFGPFSLDDSQQYLGGGKVGVNDIDHIKQGLDTLIEGQTDKVTGKVTGYGRDLVELKKRILGEVDKYVPAYKAAREAFAGPAALKTAVDKGRLFWNENAESLESLTQGMTASEKEAFRVGVAEKVREMAGGRTGQNRLMDVWQDRNTREKLQAVFGSKKQFDDAMKLLDNERTLKKLEGLGKGSQTFSRMSGAEDQTINVASDALAAGANAQTGNLAGLFGSLKKVSAYLGTPEHIRNTIGDILLGKYSPDEIKMLEQSYKAYKASQLGNALGAASVAGQGAAQYNKTLH